MHCKEIPLHRIASAGPLCKLDRPRRRRFPPSPPLRHQPRLLQGRSNAARQGSAPAMDRHTPDRFRGRWSGAITTTSVTHAISSFFFSNRLVVQLESSLRNSAQPTGVGQLMSDRSSCMSGRPRRAWCDVPSPWPWPSLSPPACFLAFYSPCL
jgi:hypothetical protein